MYARCKEGKRSWNTRKRSADGKQWKEKSIKRPKVVLDGKEWLIAALLLLLLLREGIVVTALRTRRFVDESRGLLPVSERYTELSAARQTQL